MGVHWTGIVFGLGFVISFGYWTTDFLVVQRVLAAHNLRAARMAPLIGSFFKMAVPFIVILPGLLGLVLLQNPDGSRRCWWARTWRRRAAEPRGAGGESGGVLGGDGEDQPDGGRRRSDGRGAECGTAQYNQALPLMMVRYLGPGLLGLGITALIAGFMSGMAGNVSAFSTVWSYDIYKPLIYKQGRDSHYVMVGRLSIVTGVVVSIGAAYLVQHFQGIMDYVQALFSIFMAPLLGNSFRHVLEAGDGWAGFLGLLLGIVFSASLFMWVKLNPAGLAEVALSPDAKPMAENVFRALWAFIFTAIIVICGQPVDKAKASGGVGWAGLWRDCPAQGGTGAVLQERIIWAVLVAILFVALNVMFW